MREGQWSTKDIPYQSGKLAVVTGANSGIGWHTALELARAGADVILAVRSEEKGWLAVDRILTIVPQARVRAELLDLASIGSIRSFVDRMRPMEKIDMLINNAGVMAVPERRLTFDGFEMQFGTNFLGPFLLTALLMPVLRRSRNPRVTTVCSGAANMGDRKIHFEDLQSERSYDPWKAYCQSKLADLLFAQELSRRAQRTSLVSNAAHPGYALTNLQTSGPKRGVRWYEKAFAAVAGQDAAHGALPTLRAATTLTDPDAYYAPGGAFQLKGAPVKVDVPSPGKDQEAAKRLWQAAESLTGVNFVVR